MFRQILLIAKNTYLETVRDRVIVGGVFIVLMAILFSLFVGSISVDQNARMIVDIGLSSIYLLQVFIAIFVGSTLIQKEVERKTLFILMPKIIKKDSFLIGKALGLFLVATVVTVINTLILSLILSLKTETPLAAISIATIYSSFEILTLILISMFFSLFFSSILSVMLSLSVFFIAHSHGILSTIILRTSSVAVAEILRFLYYIFPNFEKFNLRNDVVYHILPDGKNIFLTIVYFALYATLVFVVSRLFFKRKEF